MTYFAALTIIHQGESPCRRSWVVSWVNDYRCPASGSEFTGPGAQYVGRLPQSVA